MRPAGVNFYENEATGFTAIENGMVSLKFRRQQSSASDNSLEKIKRSEEKCIVEMKPTASDPRDITGVGFGAACCLGVGK